MDKLNTHERQALDLWLGKSIPRYTSYPPAPLFHEGITGLTYKDTLQSLPDSERISSYIHIPFCQHLCLYCGCHTSVTRQEDRICGYLKALQTEIINTAKYLPKKTDVMRIHFGGGTPNVLTPEQLKGLFRTLREHLNLERCDEIALELDPRTLTRSHIKTLSELGVTRVSLGIQDFDPKVQASINRHQPFDLVRDVTKSLCDHGLSNINFDLIYGLPHQTVSSIQRTTELALSLSPSRVALFSYAHVPHLKPHQKALERYPLPNDIEKLGLDQTVRYLLVGAHYQPIGMDHFVKNDDRLALAKNEHRLHRNFQGYTDDATSVLLGWGASSISEVSETFFQNSTDEMTYRRALERGEIPVVRGYQRTLDDKIRNTLIHELMCYLACDVNTLSTQYGIDLDYFAREILDLKPFLDAEIISYDKGNIKLRSQYPMAIRAIANVFDNTTGQGHRMVSKAS